MQTLSSLSAGFVTDSRTVLGPLSPEETGAPIGDLSSLGDESCAATSTLSLVLVSVAACRLLDNKEGFNASSFLITVGCLVYQIREQS